LPPLTVVGDGDGRIGMGKGKAKEVPVAVQKAMEQARRNMFKVPLKNGTLQHEVHGKPRRIRSPPGSGQGWYGCYRRRPDARSVRRDGRSKVVAKSHGSTNPYNLVRATLDGLRKQSTPGDIAAKRGKSVEDILG